MTSSSPPVKLLLFLLMAPLLVGEERVLTLSQTLERVLQVHPLVTASDLSVKRGEETLERAKGRRYLAESDVKLALGLVPSAKGDVFSSHDKSDDLDGLGPFTKMDLTIVQPLYTFGRIKSLITAANEALRMEEAKGRLTREELALETARLYWGLSLFQKGEESAKDLRKNYDKLVQEVETRLQKEDSEIDDTALLEIKSGLYAVEKGYWEAKEGREAASGFLATLLDLPGENPLRAQGETLPLPSEGELPLERVLAIAKGRSDELKAADAGVRALDAKWRLTRSNRMPLFYLAGALGYAHAGNRTDQTNPFVVDNFNYFRLGAFLGVSWNFNIFQGNHEATEAKLEYRSALEKRKALEQKVEGEARERFHELRKEAALLESVRTSLKSAKTWLQVSFDNWDMGIGEVNRLVKAYENYYKLQGESLEREYKYNLALTRFSSSVGGVSLLMEWMKNGKIVL